MRTGPVLASDAVERYQPLGAFGQPVYLSHVQLRATVLQKLGVRHANYFARPDQDLQNKRLHWIAEVPGTARRWADLSENEQALAALDLQSLRSDFLRYLDELRAAAAAGPQGQGAAAFASLLEQAMLVPDDSHLHFVGDQPVVSFWGFRSFEKPPVDPLSVAPKKPPVPPVPSQGIAISPAAASPLGLQRRRPWWHWALLALPVLLLLLLLGLSHCFQDEVGVSLFGPPPGSEPERTLNEPETPGATGQLPPEGDGGMIGWTRRFLGLDGDVPGGNVAPGPDGKLAGQAEPGTAPSATEQPEAPTPPAEPTPPDQAIPDKLPANPEAEKPEPAKPEPEKPEADKPEPAKPEPEKPEPGPAPDATKPPQPPNPEPPGPAPDASGKSAPLQIPPDAGKSGNMGFLGGEWNSDNGLVDQTTKQPLKQSYKFDEKGNGEVTIRRADGTTCQAPAQARMQNGRLSIQETGDPTCPDGRTYSRSQTECVRTPSGQTVCQGRNADGSTYRVGIQKQP